MSIFTQPRYMRGTLKEFLVNAESILYGTYYHYTLKTAFKTPPKATLDVTNTGKFAEGICLGVVTKDYAVYKK